MILIMSRLTPGGTWAKVFSFPTMIWSGSSWLIMRPTKNPICQPHFQTMGIGIRRRSGQHFSDDWFHSSNVQIDPWLKPRPNSTFHPDEPVLEHSKTTCGGYEKRNGPAPRRVKKIYLHALLVCTVEWNGRCPSPLHSPLEWIETRLMRSHPNTISRAAYYWGHGGMIKKASGTWRM